MPEGSLVLASGMDAEERGQIAATRSKISFSMDSILSSCRGGSTAQASPPSPLHHFSRLPHLHPSNDVISEVSRNALHHYRRHSNSSSCSAGTDSDAKLSDDRTVSMMSSHSKQPLSSSRSTRFSVDDLLHVDVTSTGENDVDNDDDDGQLSVSCGEEDEEEAHSDMDSSSELSPTGTGDGHVTSSALGPRTPYGAPWPSYNPLYPWLRMTLPNRKSQIIAFVA
jgi:hypothetical protein